MDDVSPIPIFVDRFSSNNTSFYYFMNSTPLIVHSSEINIATWNVEGMSDDKLICLTRSMRQHGIHILCITETHIEDSFQLRTDDSYFIFYSGSNIESPSRFGVGFIITPYIISSVIGCGPISHRLCSLRLRVFGIICAYAPHNGHSLILRQHFFES